MAASNWRAFTLIEMLVLIIILAMLSSVVVPASTRFYAKAKFQQNVQDVVGLLAYARSSAIESNSESVVRFDAQTDTFMVTRDSTTPATDVPTALQDTQDAAQIPDSKITRLGEDVMVADFKSYDPAGDSNSSMGQKMAELRFHDDGSSSGGQFVIRSMNGYSAIVEVAPMTGRATAADAADFLMGHN